MEKIIPSAVIILLISIGIGFFIASADDSIHVYKPGDGDYTVQLLTSFLERLPLSLLAGLLLTCAFVLGSSFVSRLFVNHGLREILFGDIATLLPLLVTLLIPLRYIGGLGQSYAYLFLITGPLMPALLTVAIILCIYLKLITFRFPWLHGKERGRLLPRLTSSSIAAGVFVILAIFYLISAPVFAENSIFGGDQPHYLVVTHSMLEDGDIYIEDDHDDGVVDQFTPIQTEPQFFKRTVDDKIIPFHRIGLPLMAIIPYWLAGKTGVIVFMGLLSALSAALIFLLTDKIVRNRRASLWATAFVSLTTPILLLSYQFFSEVAAATITLIVLNMIIRTDENRGPLLPWLIPFIIWTLPWMHARDMITALALTAFLVVRMRSSMLSRGGILLLSLILAMGIPVFNYAFYGTFSLVAEMGGDKTAFGLMNVVRGFGGMFFDQEFGFLLYNPGLILIFPGMLSLFRKRPNLTIWLIIIAGFSVGPNILYRMWWGGGSAPGRYYVAVLHLAAIPLAQLLSYHQRYNFRRLFVVLCLVGIVFAGVMLVDNQNMVNDRDGTARILTSVSAHSVDAVEWFPSWFSGLERSWVLAAIITLFTVLTAAAILFLGRIVPFARLDSPGGVLGALLLTLISAGIYAPIAEAITPGEPNEFMPTSHQLDQLYLSRIRSGQYQRIDVLGNNADGRLPAIRRSAEFIYSTRNLDEDAKASRNRSRLLSAADTIPIFDEERPLWMGSYTIEISLRSVARTGSSTITIFDLGQPASAPPLASKNLNLTDDFQNFTLEFDLTANIPGLLVKFENKGDNRFQHVIIQPERLESASTWSYPMETFSKFFWKPGNYYLITDSLELFRPEAKRFWTWGDYQGTWLLLSRDEFDTVSVDAHSRSEVRLTLESENDGTMVAFSTIPRHRMTLHPRVEKRGDYWMTVLTIEVEGHFTPAELDADSTDNRKLGASLLLELIKE